LIGRIAFPIYAYLIAQGCKYTKDINKFLLRLGIFALISEIPFDIAFMHYSVEDGVLDLNINFIDETNVFYTLFLGVASIIVYEKIKTRSSTKLETSTDIRFPRKFLAVVSTIPILCLGAMMDTDYGMMGVIYILFFYLMKPEDRTLRTIAAFSVVFLKYAYPIIFWRMDALGIGLFILPGGMSASDNLLYEFLFALIAVILIFLYNGRQGPKAKWFFYVFYPAHIAVLAVIWFMFVRV
jgi:hypothetical protein